MRSTPPLVLRESPRRIPERIREFDTGIRAIVRPSLLYGIPCSLAALYFYHAWFAPRIDPPPQPDPTFGILVAPFIVPLIFTLIRRVLSLPRFRGTWRRNWTIRSRSLVEQSAFGAFGVAWRDVTECVVEQHDDEIVLRLVLERRLLGLDRRLELACLREDVPCDADALQERLDALIADARPLRA